MDWSLNETLRKTGRPEKFRNKKQKNDEDKNPKSLLKERAGRTAELDLTRGTLSVPPDAGAARRAPTGPAGQR